MRQISQLSNEVITYDPLAKFNIEASLSFSISINHVQPQTQVFYKEIQYPGEGNTVKHIIPCILHTQNTSNRNEIRYSFLCNSIRSRTKSPLLRHHLNSYGMNNYITTNHSALYYNDLGYKYLIRNNYINNNVFPGQHTYFSAYSSVSSLWDGQNVPSPWKGVTKLPTSIA